MRYAPLAHSLRWVSLSLFFFVQGAIAQLLREGPSLKSPELVFRFLQRFHPSPSRLSAEPSETPESPPLPMTHALDGSGVPASAFSPFIHPYIHACMSLFFW